MKNYILGIRSETVQASVTLVCHPELVSEAAPGLTRGSTIELVDHTTWTAGRQLSATLLSTIDELLARNNLTWHNLSGIVAYEGPGSFTGLRIGITVANTAAFILNIPIIGATGDDWLEWGSQQLKSSDFTSIVMPFYGAEANITKPKGHI